MQKYRIIEDDYIMHHGEKLFRIQSLCYIPKAVCPYEYGGYIGSEEVLSQDDRAWVSYGAIVTKDVRLRGNVLVDGKSVITGKVSISTVRLEDSIEKYFLSNITNAIVEAYGSIVNANIEYSHLTGSIKLFNVNIDGCKLRSGDKEIINDTDYARIDISDMESDYNFKCDIDAYNYGEIHGELYSIDGTTYFKKDINSTDELLEILNPYEYGQDNDNDIGEIVQLGDI